MVWYIVSDQTLAWFSWLLIIGGISASICGMSESIVSKSFYEIVQLVGNPIDTVQCVK